MPISAPLQKRYDWFTCVFWAKKGNCPESCCQQCQHIFVMKSLVFFAMNENDGCKLKMEKKAKNGLETCEKSDGLVSCKLWLKIIYSEVTTATITTASKKIGKIYGYRQYTHRGKVVIPL